MKEKLDNELNIPITEGDNNISNIPGDTLLITGNIEPGLKLSYTDKFTSTSEDSVFDFDNTFTPRILLATASCIGAGLDSDEVYGVIRIGFPESILNFIQEMGRCGRNRDSNQDEPTDTFVLIISLNDYVYMIERIYDTKESDEKETEENLNVFHQIMTHEKKQESKRNDLLGVLKLIVFYNDGKCIHNELKKAVSNPYESNTSSDIDDVCLHACSLCLKTYNKSMLPVRKVGLQNFLAHTFLSSQGLIVNVNNVQTLLKNYTDVGKEVYGRKTTRPPEAKFIQMTILQLVATGILEIQCNNKKPSAIFVLGISDNICPRYLIDDAWNGIVLID